MRTKNKSIIACLVAGCSLSATFAAQVYIGGDNSPGRAYPNLGVVRQYLDYANEWTWVRANADGYYLNNFCLTTDTTDANQNEMVQRLAGLFTHKNVFYESDNSADSDLSEKIKIDILRQYFNVSVTALNDSGDRDPRYSASRIQALQWRAWRPVLAMGGPWTINGNIMSNDYYSRTIRNAINAMSGSASDGPMGYWWDNTSKMREGSRDFIWYSHGQSKQAMHMMATFTSGSSANYLRDGQNCVRWLENNSAAPDYWVLSYYASDLQWYQVTPETVNGQPAATVTGLAWWLIHHLRDPAHYAKLSAPAQENVVLAENAAVIGGSKKFSVPHSAPASRIPGVQDVASFKLDLSNSSEWLDLAPVIRAKTTGNDQAYNISFKLGDKDVTDAIIGKQGFEFINADRLEPSTTRNLVVQVSPKSFGELAPGISDFAGPLKVEFELMSHSTEPEVKQKFTATFLPHKQSPDSFEQWSGLAPLQQTAAARP
jgi:hypothetical protein